MKFVFAIVGLIISFSIFSQQDSILTEGLGFLNGAKLGMSKQELKKLGFSSQKYTYTKIKYKLFPIGVPGKKHRKLITKTGFTNNCWKYSNHNVYFFFYKKKLNCILVKDKSITTKSGLKLNMSEEQIEAVYGKNVFLGKNSFITYQSKGIGITTNECGLVNSFWIFDSSYYGFYDLIIP